MSDIPPDPPFNPFAAPLAPEQEPVQQPRKRGRPPKSKKPAAKSAPQGRYDLQTILTATRILKEGDQDLFEKVLTAFADAPKPVRDRVLRAMQEIFG